MKIDIDNLTEHEKEIYMQGVKDFRTIVLTVLQVVDLIKDFYINHEEISLDIWNNMDPEKIQKEE